MNVILFMYMHTRVSYLHWQFGPEVFDWHSHTWFCSPTLIQCPPFLHGLGIHGLTEKK